MLNKITNAHSRSILSFAYILGICVLYSVISHFAVYPNRIVHPTPLQMINQGRRPERTHEINQAN